MNYREDRFRVSSEKLRVLRDRIRGIAKKARGTSRSGTETSERLEALFRSGMDEDLHVGRAIDGLSGLLAEKDRAGMMREEASALLGSLQRIDRVLQVLF
jgi:cysteinyl-tRNA synthetase